MYSRSGATVTAHSRRAAAMRRLRRRILDINRGSDDQQNGLPALRDEAALSRSNGHDGLPAQEMPLA